MLGAVHQVNGWISSLVEPFLTYFRGQETARPHATSADSAHRR